jgi:hypothetical protein
MCHPEELLLSCHPEERSDEGSAFVNAVVDSVTQEQILRFAQDDRKEGAQDDRKGALRMTGKGRSG